MLKKLTLFVALVLLFVVAVQAEPSIFVRGQAGFMGTTAQLQKGKIWGTAELSFLAPVYGEKGQIAVGGSYEAVHSAVLMSRFGPGISQCWCDHA